MKEWVEHLLALQDIDMRIRRMRMRQKMLPIEQTKLAEEQKVAAVELKEKSEKSKKCDLAIKQLESAINSLNAEISKLQSQSVMVKKNDEYRALLSEIEHRKNRISELETEEIMLMDQYDADRQQFNEYEKQYKARVKAIDDEIKELDTMGEELTAEIKRQLTARKGFESKLTVDVLSIYNNLLKSNGTPLVKITNGNCGNCHLKLIPQTVTEAKKGKVITCENCSHLLYIDEN